MPTTRVRVTEQNPADATFGFGVVFSDQALDFLQADDPDTHALITPQMEFALDYFTRSGRLDFERLRDLSPGFSAQYEQWSRANDFLFGR